VSLDELAVVDGRVAVLPFGVEGVEIFANHREKMDHGLIVKWKRVPGYHISL
jgi:hypothetical protein